MVNHNYVLFVIFLFVSLVISHIDCEGRVSIMTVPVSAHCLILLFGQKGLRKWRTEALLWGTSYLSMCAAKQSILAMSKV